MTRKLPGVAELPYRPVSTVRERLPPRLVRAFLGRLATVNARDSAVESLAPPLRLTPSISFEGYVLEAGGFSALLTHPELRAWSRANLVAAVTAFVLHSYGRVDPTAAESPRRLSGAFAPRSPELGRA